MAAKLGDSHKMVPTSIIVDILNFLSYTFCMLSVY